MIDQKVDITYVEIKFQLLLIQGHAFLGGLNFSIWIQVTNFKRNVR